MNKKDPSGKDEQDIWSFPGEYYASRGYDLDDAWRNTLNSIAEKGSELACESLCHALLGKGIGKVLGWAGLGGEGLTGLASTAGESILTYFSCKYACKKTTGCLSNYADQLERQRQKRKRDEYFNSY